MADFSVWQDTPPEKGKADDSHSDPAGEEINLPQVASVPYDGAAHLRENSVPNDCGRLKKVAGGTIAPCPPAKAFAGVRC